MEKIFNADGKVIYVNDFVDRSRVKKVYVQADAPFRMKPEDFNRWYFRNDKGEMVPFTSIGEARWTYGPMQLIFFSGVSGKNRANKMEIDLYDPQVAELIGERRHQQLIDDVELLGAGREFDLDEVRAGRLSPVFFGSALTNFGVEPFLEEFLRMTPSPLPREADCGVIDTFSPDFSAFVFKIQANMNKAHRDRLAFMRICSGQFQRDAEYYHVQSGKKMRLSQPQQLMASEREIVDEAYAGDIIGVFDPGIFSIGDTITVPGKKFKFGGIPTFAPEHFARVSAKDSMKRKQFLKGTEQIAQEGAIQIFKVPNSGMEEVIVGVVGTLQFDVFQ